MLICNLLSCLYMLCQREFDHTSDSDPKKGRLKAELDSIEELMRDRGCRL